MFNPLHLFLIEDNWDMLACFLKLIKQFMICEKNCNALEKHNFQTACWMPTVSGQCLVFYVSFLPVLWQPFLAFLLRAGRGMEAVGMAWLLFGCVSLSVVSDSAAPWSVAHLAPLECVAMPFFRASSWPRDQTLVSCITYGFFTVWATRGKSVCTLTRQGRFYLMYCVWSINIGAIWLAPHTPPLSSSSGGRRPPSWDPLE